MEAKELNFILLSVLISGCTSTTINNQNLETRAFKNFAYTICIGSAFKSMEVKEDANRTANGYMERSNISLDAYQELRSRIKSWLSRDYASKSGKSLQIMKCNDFYNSGEIQKIYNKYDPCKSTEGWLDISDYDRQCK